MLIKKKSLIVVTLSCVVISAVLTLTLIGYYMYIELKERDDAKVYALALKKLQAGIFSKYVSISDLTCTVEQKGPLKGKPVIKGVIANRSARGLYDIIIRVNFLDAEGAPMYEVMFKPQEPALGMARLDSIAKTYLTPSHSTSLNANSFAAFKRIITKCPKELIVPGAPGKTGKKGASSKKESQWSGKISAEVVSLNL